MCVPYILVHEFNNFEVLFLFAWGNLFVNSEIQLAQLRWLVWATSKLCAQTVAATAFLAHTCFMEIFTDPAHHSLHSTAHFDFPSHRKWRIHKTDRAEKSWSLKTKFTRIESGRNMHSKTHQNTLKCALKHALTQTYKYTQIILGMINFDFTYYTKQKHVNGNMCICKRIQSSIIMTGISTSFVVCGLSWHHVMDIAWKIRPNSKIGICVHLRTTSNCPKIH